MMLFTILLATTILAQINLDFTINIEDRFYYPNETIEINVSIINRETAFTAKDVKLTLNVGNRFYNYDLDDIKAGGSFEKTITLPPFPQGTHTVKGILNYTSLFDEVFTLETYNSFKVRFPEIERFPRDIKIIGFELPDKIFAGKTYDVSVLIKNDGTIPANLVIEVGSLDEFKSEEVTLDSGESKTLTLSVLFYNTGISLIEARVFALVDDVKYLVTYSAKKAFIVPERIAKLSFDRIELIDEQDNEINQNDEVNLKIYLSNEGEYSAMDVVGILSSENLEIEIVNSTVNYNLIAPAESNANPYNFFKIIATNAEVKDYVLELSVDYFDSEMRKASFNIPLTIISDTCNSDEDCKENQTCTAGVCEELTCECGYAENHKCISYECCSDEQCGEDMVCNQETHACGIPSDLIRDVLIVTIGNEINKNDDYLSILGEYKEILKADGLSSFYIELDSPKVEKFFNIKLDNQEDWKAIKLVLDKILHKTNSKYLLILGGVDVVPMPEIENGCFFDFPNGVPTDDLYGDLNLDKKPDTIVARIPTGRGSKSIGTIVKVLQKSINLHKAKVNVKKPFFIGDTCVGYLDSPYAEEKMSVNNYLTSHASCQGDINECIGIEDFTNGVDSDMVYFIVHGDGRAFMAEVCEEDSYSYAEILNAKTVSKYTLPDTFMTVACFGGAIDLDGYHRDLYKDESTTVSFLNNGVGYYGGNTLYGLTIGGAPRIEGSVGVDMGVYKKMLEGKTIGESVLETKNNLLKKAKTECEFAVIFEKQLYGDPTLKSNMG